MSQPEYDRALDVALDRFRARNRPPGKPCAILTADLNRTQRRLLDAALADRSIQARAIVEMVADEWGVDSITLPVVKHHRGGRCVHCR